MKLSSFFLRIRLLSLRIRSLFSKYEEEGVVVVGREEFAREVKEDFRGNTRFLKAIEECMNRNVKKHECVSLTD